MMNSKNKAGGQAPPTLQAIETEYRGYRFRSRLEARWAVFFDALNVEWVYEEEGFDLPSGWYLPDFRIRFQGTYGFRPFIEIKPKGFITENPRGTEYFKMKDLVDASDDMGFILAGDPFDARMRREISILSPLNTDDWDHHLSVKVNAFMKDAFVPLLDLRNPTVFAAALKARQARFEHGEQG